jgi:hypothetical protein
MAIFACARPDPPATNRAISGTGGGRIRGAGFGRGTGNNGGRFSAGDGVGAIEGVGVTLGGIDGIGVTDGVSVAVGTGVGVGTGRTPTSSASPFRIGTGGISITSRNDGGRGKVASGRPSRNRGDRLMSESKFGAIKPACSRSIRGDAEDDGCGCAMTWRTGRKRRLIAKISPGGTGASQPPFKAELKYRGKPLLLFLPTCRHSTPFPAFAFATASPSGSFGSRDA